MPALHGERRGAARRAFTTARRKERQFDKVMGKFALAYADQAERDHAALRAAVRAGVVEVQLEH